MWLDSGPPGKLAGPDGDGVSGQPEAALGRGAGGVDQPWAAAPVLSRDLHGDPEGGGALEEEPRVSAGCGRALGLASGRGALPRGPVLQPGPERGGVQ